MKIKTQRCYAKRFFAFTPIFVVFYALAMGSFTISTGAQGNTPTPNSSGYVKLTFFAQTRFLLLVCTRSYLSEIRNLIYLR